MLSFDQVNDDYCDCPDGSDEPGTNACPGTQFYCENAGFKPGYIPSFKLNDGVCDYEECCDGSDEWDSPVECPNRCQEVNEQFQKEQKEKQHTYKVGFEKVLKIIEAARKTKSKLETSLESQQGVFNFVSGELERYKEEYAKKRANSKNELVSEVKAALNAEIENHFSAISQQESNLSQLKQILTDLVENFNENLNDEAVKSCVEEFKALDLPEFEFTTDFTDLLGDLDGLKSSVESQLNSYSEISNQVKSLESLLESLLRDYNPNFNDLNVKSVLNSYQSYLSDKSEEIKNPFDLLPIIDDKFKQIDEIIAIPEAPQDEGGKPLPMADIEYVGFVNKLKFKLQDLVEEFLDLKRHKVKKSSGPAITAEAFTELPKSISELEREYSSLSSQISSMKHELEFNYGPEDVLRPLKDITVKNHIGEYDYEVGYLGEVRQTGHGNSVRIGQFDNFEIVDNQFKLHYSNGEKCWNGPKRSATVLIECGTDPELVSVTEPEKCEYLIRIKAPIGCMDLSV